MNSRLKKIDEIFLKRIKTPSVIISTLWLYTYTSFATLILGAFFVLATSYFAPELYGTIGQGAGQKNLRWFPTLIFNPLVESIILATAIRISAKFDAGPTSVIIAALLLSILHSLQNLLWGVTVFCFFLIQSYAFFNIYKAGFMHSYAVISLAHSLHNASVLIAILIVGVVI